MRRPIPAQYPALRGSAIVYELHVGSDALIVKAYAMSAPTRRFVVPIGDVLTATEESKTR